MRFAVGDTHTVRFDEQHRVIAITWQGKTWRFTSTSTCQGKTYQFNSSVVMTPASAIGHISGGERRGSDGRGWLHAFYEAPNWSWADTGDPEAEQACMDEFLRFVLSNDHR